MQRNLMVCIIYAVCIMTGLALQSSAYAQSGVTPGAPGGGGGVFYSPPGTGGFPSTGSFNTNSRGPQIYRIDLKYLTATEVSRLFGLGGQLSQLTPGGITSIVALPNSERTLLVQAYGSQPVIALTQLIEMVDRPTEQVDVDVTLVITDAAEKPFASFLLADEEAQSKLHDLIEARRASIILLPETTLSPQGYTLIEVPGFLGYVGAIELANKESIAAGGLTLQATIYSGSVRIDSQKHEVSASQIEQINQTHKVNNGQTIVLGEIEHPSMPGKPKLKTIVLVSPKISKLPEAAIATPGILPAPSTIADPVPGTEPVPSRNNSSRTAN